MRARDFALERSLTDTAARAASLPNDGGLGRFADERARPGGVVVIGRDFVREVREELSDARNYCVWHIEAIYADYLTGDAVAGEQYMALMTALRAVVVAWHALRVLP